MAKAKKAFLKVSRKASQARGNKQQKGINPFEIHTNKRKHDILGRRIKHERGVPGVSRSKAIKKRQKTLLVEYKKKNKANMFIDRRFGEYDERMSLEDKMMKRFTMEKKHHHERRGLYTLEDEELTHLGQSLGEINKFEDVHLSDDDDDDDNTEEIEDVKELHFGGFLTKKKIEDKQSDENTEKHKSRKEIMEEVVAKAKIKKHERQMAREETISLTEQLDKDWKSLKGLISQRGPHSEKKVVKLEADDYDIAVRQLAFEMKGKATDRLKSEQELAREEQARLEKLELQRQIRMKGLPTVEEKPKHRSADDLGDSFTPATDERVLLSYGEAGPMINVEGEDNDSEVNGSDGEFEQDDYKDQMEEHSDADRGDDDDDGDDVDDDDDDNDDDDDDDDDDDGDDDDDDDGDDDHAVEEEGDEEDEEESVEDGDGADLDSDVSDKDEEKNADVSQPKQQEPTRQRVGEEDISLRKDLPYTFKAPKSFAEFQELIAGWSYKDQLTIVSRIKACHNPKITPDNKPKMQVFFTILLEYIGQLALKGSEGLKMIDKLSRPLFDVAQHSPVSAAKYMQKKVKAIHRKFTEDRDRKGGKGAFLDLSELMYLRIVPMLFSASDFQHAVCTPAMFLMSQVLAESPVRCIRDVFRGLFICELFIAYLSLSKRFVPETVNFLCGILFLASEKEGRAPQLVTPFKPGSKWRDLLKLQSDTSSLSPRPLPLTKTLGESTEDLNNDETRVNSLNCCLRLLHKFVDLYKDLPSSFEIFSPVRDHLLRIQLDVYPSLCKELHNGLVEKIAELHRKTLTRRPLTLQARKPKAIRTFEPKFEEHYEIRSRRAGSKTANERQKLRYKYKKEFKGAIREIRKDNQFLAKEKLQEQLQRDAERMRKVKELEHMLSNQQAEANALNRKKRKLGK